MASYVIRFAKGAGIVALFVVAAMLGTLSGVLFAYAGDLPEISALDHYNPNTITRVYSGNGELIGDFAVERRLVVGYEDISPFFRQALIAAEDAGFDTHVGLSVSAILLRLSRDVIDGIEARFAHRATRPAGASTLTQQLARNLFPEVVGYRIGDISLERKIKEAIVAVQIEKRYTKREILTLYANQMLFGHGTYGIEAASHLYFGKTAKELTLEEAALLAGIIQSPARQSPYVNMDAAKRRRGYVLQRMADEGYISQQQAEAANKTPITLAGQPKQPQSIAPFFLEEIRKYLERQYGAKALYESGLSVTTTLDPTLQQVANHALQNGLRRLDKDRGWRRDKRNVIAQGKTIDSFKDERWLRPIREGDIVPAIVVSIAAGKTPTATAARLTIGKYHAELTKEGFAWTHRTNAADLFKAGDVIDVEIKKLDEESGTATVSLEQTPLVEGALVAIDNKTGQIRAMVGGWDFNRSKFNRAVQAMRQMGSTFKPIVYTTAIDRGFTPVSIIIDEPVSWTSDIGQVYAPNNYDHKFEGAITLRRALEDSRNIPAVKMMETVGPKNVLGYAKRFGFEEEFPPYLAIALGAGDATLMEVTSAYTVFPNQGVRMKPFDILKVMDRDGNLLEENRSEPIDVIRADTAFVMTNLLRGVVLRGTAEAAASIDWPLAGKTGTVDDNTDAWFIGFDPDITVGVWTGLDEKKTLGRTETGAVAALPIWMEFMKAYIAGRPDKDHRPEFQAPGNIVFLPVDKATGSVTTPEAAGSISEAFIAGTQPSGLNRLQ
ncbi:MAG TPA: PBP1A family penicillin-binding protein [Vicinamibacterales bacterium]